MHVTVKASLILAALVAVFSILVYVTGLHENFMVGQLVFLAVAIAVNVAVVYWALHQTAAVNTYGGQVLNAAVIGVFGGVLVLLVSWLLLSFAFPNVLAETRQAAIEYMQAAGVPEAEYNRQLEMLERATPMSQSIPGGVGTFFTGLVAGAVFAIFKRKKE